MMGTLVVVLAAIGVTGFFVMRGGGEPAPAVFHVTGHPTGLAVTGGQVWVATPQTGALTVLDAESGRPVGEPVRTGGAPTRLALGANAAWVADAERGAIVPVRRDRSRTYRPIRVGGDVADVALAAGAVWALDSAQGVVRTLEPGGRPIRALSVGPDPVDVAATDRWVAAASAADASLTWVDAWARKVAGRVQLGGVPVAVAVTGDRAFVADTLIRVDLNSGKAIGSIPVGARPIAVAADGDDVYVLCAGDRTVWNVDGANGDVQWKRPAGRDPSALALDARDVWVADAGDDAVIRLER
jgi:DNA-binding beta-propeller fold protein YncE